MNDIDKESPNSPIYLIRGGNVNLSTGSLRYGEIYGAYWVRTVFVTSLIAYYLNYHNANISPANSTNRWDGFAVRVV